MLAGVNGAGKSSILGRYLEAHQGIAWFNPDAYARELVTRAGYEQGAANAAAWQENLRRLDQALRTGAPYAFETTLGGNTVPRRIRAAAETRDVFLWYCGLASPEQHLARVQARVALGGHDIDEARIRERFVRAPLNLMALMPVLVGLRVYDNSAEAALGETAPNPRLVLSCRDGRLLHPDPADPVALAATPSWARPVVESAIRLRRRV